jgi:hypothetical protein
MPYPFTVAFTIQAESLDDAENIVSGWTVTPGATLTLIQGTVLSDQTPITVPDSGLIRDGEKRVQPPVPLPDNETQPPGVEA